MGSCRCMEMWMDGQVVLEKVSVILPQCWPRFFHLHTGLDGVKRVRSVLSDLWALSKIRLWTVSSDQHWEAMASANVLWVNAGLSVGLRAASCGKLLAPSQLGLSQILSLWACSLALSPHFVRQKAPTSECQKLLVVSTVIPQCVFP